MYIDYYESVLIFFNLLHFIEVIIILVLMKIDWLFIEFASADPRFLNPQIHWSIFIFIKHTLIIHWTFWKFRIHFRFIYYVWKWCNQRNPILFQNPLNDIIYHNYQDVGKVRIITIRTLIKLFKLIINNNTKL